MLLPRLLLTILLVSLAAGARAQRDTYFSLFSGDSTTQHSSIHLVNAAKHTDIVFHGVTWETDPLDPAIYYGVRFGTFSVRHPHWGVELNFTHNKAILDTGRSVETSGAWNGQPVSGQQPIGARIQTLRITHGENIIGLNILYRSLGKPTPSFPSGRFQAYAGLGPTFLVLYNANRVDGVGNQGAFHTSGFGYEALAGIRYGVIHRVSIFIEPKYTSGNANLETGDGGSLSTPLGTWHVAVGIIYDLK